MLDSLAERLDRGDGWFAALTLGNKNDPRALPKLLELLSEGSSNASAYAVFRAMENIIDPSAGPVLREWVERKPEHSERQSAAILLQKIDVMSGGGREPSSPLEFDRFVDVLVNEANAAIARFRSDHSEARPCAFAFDGDPYEGFFACCLDSSSRDGSDEETEVGYFEWHLYHEFEIDVRGVLPEEIPLSPTLKDGYVEFHFRPILEKASRILAESGAFEELDLARPFMIGYAYHSEPLIVCARVS